MDALMKLQEYLSYEPTTGKFRWIKSPRPFVKAGQLAGGANHRLGYCRIGLEGKVYLSHRLAWLFYYGEWPKQLDHINGRPADNRIANLRICDQRGNNGNRKPRKNGTSQFKGVSLHKKQGGWKAQITKWGKCNYLGYFKNERDAARTYDAAAKKYFGEFARLNFPQRSNP